MPAPDALHPDNLRYNRLENCISTPAVASQPPSWSAACHGKTYLEHWSLRINMRAISPRSKPHIGLSRACAGLALTLSLAAGLPSASMAADAEATQIKPEALYHNYCSVCHGDRGDGRSRASKSLVPPPRDFTTATNLSRETMITIVTHGKPGTAMTGWQTQLNPREVESVVDYIRTNFMKIALDPVLSQGRSVYVRNCVACHGESGRGLISANPQMGAQPRNFVTDEARSTLTRERMIASITNGRPGTAMAAFGGKLPAQDIEAVARYIREVLMEDLSGSISGTRANTGKQQTSTVAWMDEPMPKGLKGNLQRGKTFYMNNCFTCHGVKGDGQGPRAYFINPKPRNFLSSQASTYNRPTLFNAIAEGRNGSEMPAWNKVLNDQQIADVAEFVFRAFIQPQGKPAEKPGK